MSVSGTTYQTWQVNHGTTKKHPSTYYGMGVGYPLGYLGWYWNELPVRDAMIIALCGCGCRVEKINDGKNEFIYVAAMCQTCVSNDGDYTLSPHFDDTPEAEKPQKKKRRR